MHFLQNVSRQMGGDDTPRGAEQHRKRRSLRHYILNRLQALNDVGQLHFSGCWQPSRQKARFTGIRRDRLQRAQIFALKRRFAHDQRRDADQFRSGAIRGRGGIA